MGQRCRGHLGLFPHEGGRSKSDCLVGVVGRLRLHWGVHGTSARLSNSSRFSYTTCVPPPSRYLNQASGNNYQFIFTLAATVSLASCLAFVMLVPSHVRPSDPVATASSGSAPQQQGQEKPQGFQLAKLMTDVWNMGADFYRMLLVVGLYCSSHINESLLEARAIEVGFGKAESTLVIAGLALTVFVAAWPLGRLDDQYGPRITFAVGLLAHIAADLVLMASGTHPWAVFVSLIFMGVHVGVMNGPLLSIVVANAPAHLRGTAFGIFYTIMAFVATLANSGFGWLWHSFGAPSAFGASACVTTVTLLALPWLLPASSREVRAQPSPA